MTYVGKVGELILPRTSVAVRQSFSLRFLIQNYVNTYCFPLHALLLVHRIQFISTIQPHDTT
jgi:hypothetical protein